MSVVMANPDLNFRSMEMDDVERVMAIEPYAYLVPWTEGIVRDCIAIGYECWVAESRGRIIGYSFMSVAVDEAHLLNLTIDPKQQGKGYGRQLLEFMLGVAEQQGVVQVFLEVRPSNDKAIELYRSMGFSEIGIRKGYYPDIDNKREDALVFSTYLHDPV
jgi:ribosomal-protein-alanine N-acetyltransferase